MIFNKSIKTISLLLVSIFLFSFFCVNTISVINTKAVENTTEFAGGNGTFDNPYKISDTTQLNNIRNHLDAHFILTTNIVFTSDEYEANGLFNKNGFEPIGNSNNPFTGTFNGNGFNISGMIIKNKNRTAMFDTIGNNGIIKNLGLIDCKFTSSDTTTTSDSANTSTIAGSYSYSAPFVITNKGTVENCFSNANVEASSTSSTGRGMASPRSYSYAAGIVCENYGIIKNCYNRSHIIAKATSWYYYTVTTIAESTTCGIVAKMYNNSMVENCYSISEGTTTSTTGRFYYYDEIKSFSGTQEPIVDKNIGTITNCYYLDTIKNVITGTSLSDSEMQQKESFLGFDFESIWKIDSSGDYKYPQLIGHKHSYIVSEIAPTCTENGVKTYACVCSEKRTETILTTGHSYEEVITPPTVTEQGYTTYTCSSCGDNFIDNYVDAIGITLSGTVTSYLSDTDEITITLTKLDDENVSYTTIVTGTLAEYSIEAIEPGTYTITVSKSNHTTRNYEITINNNETTQDIKICPIGDANGDGKISVLDYTQLLRHVKKTSTLDGYEFDCADVNRDGKLSVLDYTKLLRHVKKTETLW